jgi:MSHA biogenesis protein MshJ
MTRYWNLLSERVDKLNLRERAMVLAAALLLVYTAMDTLLVAPVQAARKAALDGYTQRQNEINTVTATLEALARSRSESPDAAAARLNASRANLASLESDAKELSARLMSPDRMRDVLQQILARRQKLELVQMKTLPQSVVGAPGDAQKAVQPAQPAEPRGEAAPASAIYKHGIQLTVRGSYLDLLAYLKEIESLPVRIYWDKLDLSTAEYPTATLRVTLYTVSLDKTWMQV